MSTGTTPGFSEVVVARFGVVEWTAGAVAIAGVVVGFSTRPSSSERPALVSDSPAPTHPAAPASVPSGKSAVPSGNLVATMPEAAFGPADGAPARIIAGKAYAVVATVWVAPGSGPANVDVVSTAGGLTGCANRRVGAGITRLHCTFMPIESSASTDVDVSAHLSDGTDARRSYAHQIS